MNTTAATMRVPAYGGLCLSLEVPHVPGPGAVDHLPGAEEQREVELEHLLVRHGGQRDAVCPPEREVGLRLRADGRGHWRDRAGFVGLREQQGRRPRIGADDGRAVRAVGAD